MTTAYQQLPLFVFEKLCSKCQQVLPREAFHPDPTKKAGLSSQCKACKSKNFAHLQAVDPHYRERNKQRSAEWREQHPDAWRRWAVPRLAQLARAHQLWCRANSDKCRAASRRRLRRIRDQWVERVDRAAVLARDGYWCHICQSAVSPDEVGYDHVIPLSKGGAHSMENVKVCHRRCNLRKQARLEKWLR